MSEPHQFETLAGGVSVTVNLHNGQGLTEEIVTCRKLPIRQMPALAQAWTKEVLELKLYVQRSSGEIDDKWMDNLTDESWEALIKEGRRMNFFRFNAFFERQKAALMAMGTDIVETVAKAINQA